MSIINITCLTKLVVVIVLVTSVAGVIQAQEPKQFPDDGYNAHLYREVTEQGEEFYASGRIYAKGPLLAGTKVNTGGRDSTYVAISHYRTGHWKVFYDSAELLQSEGTYNEGKKDGIWKTYSIQGKQTGEYVFSMDYIQSQVRIDSTGQRTTIVAYTDAQVFARRHDFLLLFAALIPMMLIRTGWNLATWNRIYKTKHMLITTRLRDEEQRAIFYCFIIFWLLSKTEDTISIKRHKKTGNWISAVTALNCITILFFLEYNK